MLYKGYQEDFKKILNDKNMVELDLSNPEHAAFYLKQHGGEETLKSTYPAIYAAFVKSGKVHESNSKKRVSTADERKAPEFASPYCCFIDTELIPQAQHALRAASEIVNLNAKVTANVDLEEITHVSISGYVENADTHEILTNAGDLFNREDIEKLKGLCVIECREVIDEAAVQSLFYNFYYEFIDFTGIIYPVVYQEMYTIEERANSPIKRFKVEDPRIKRLNPGEEKQVRIMYNNRTTSKYKPDYTYGDVKEITDPQSGEKAIGVYLPMKGEFTLKEGYQPVGLSEEQFFDIKLFYPGKKSVRYNHDLFDEFHHNFKINGQTVSFELGNNWNTFFKLKDITAYSLTAILRFQITYTYKYKNEKGREILSNLFLRINSKEKLPKGQTYNESNTDNVYIPEIFYLWGCFSKDTRIRMSDGSEKLINKINPGELVAVYEGEPVKVREVTGGTEKTLVHIETQSGRHIALTDTHPVLTERGTVIACEINAADRMIMEDGGKEDVKYLYSEEYQDQIYNLDLGSAHMIYANGFIAGDLKQQNSNVNEKKRDKALAPDVIELLSELSKLKANLQKK